MNRAKCEKKSQRRRATHSTTSSEVSNNNNNTHAIEQVPIRHPSSISYGPAELASLIGNSETEIPDDIIVAALNLMKSVSDPLTQRYVGYFTPAEIQYGISVTSHEASSLVKPILPHGMFSINIHPLVGHWVTSCYYPNTNQLHVYDSLMSQAHFQQVIPQLKLIYGEEKTSRAIYSQVTQQGFQPLCGVMAVCYAFTCILGKNPALIDFDITRARDHLRQCIIQGELLPFPEKRLQFSSRQVFTNNAMVDDTLLSLNRYFKDQNVRSTECQLKKQMTQTECVKQNISNTNKTSASHRHNLKKERQRKRQYSHRILMSKSEKQEQKQKDKRRKHRSRSSLSEAELLVLKEKDKLRKQLQRNLESENKKTTIKMRDKLRKQLARGMLKDNEIEKKTINIKDKLRKQSARSSLKENEIEMEKHKDKVRKQSARSSLKENEIQMKKIKDKSRKQSVRSNLKENEIVSEKNKDKLRKQTVKKKMTESEKNSVKNKNKLNQQAVRKQMTESKKQIAKNTDKLRKHASRDVMKENQKQNTKLKDKLKHRLTRNSISEISKLHKKSKETARKQYQRSLLTNSKRQDIMQKDRFRHERKRKSLTPVEIDLQNTLDRSRQESKRKKMKVCEKERHNEKTRKMRQDKRHKTSSFSDAILQFHFAVLQGPIYVCASCLRYLYKQSVVEMKENKYQSSIGQLITKEHSTFGKVWLCNTCHKYLIKDKTPPQNFTNNMTVDKIPSEIADLTSLESHLISQRIPFMKIMSRPRGGQKAITGAVVNVPVDAYDTCRSLPRPPPNSAFIMLKLKRKQEYKSSVVNQVIRPTTVTNALKHLININPLYSNIEQNEQAFTIDSGQEDHELWNKILGQDKECSESTDECNSDTKLIERNTVSESQKGNSELLPDNNNSQSQSNSEKEKESGSTLETLDKNELSEDEDLEILDSQKGLPLDTCLQPLECQGNDIFSIAPAEGNKPVSLLSDPNAELLAFPVLFPFGRYSSNSDRPIKLHFRKYLNARLLNVDTRFATNIDYIFFMQFLAEKKQIVENV